MNHQDLSIMQQMIDRAVAGSVSRTVPIVVNGKIDQLAKKFDDHIEEHRKQTELMKPILDTFNAWSGWRKGMTLILGPIAYTAGIGASVALIYEAIFNHH